MKSISFDLIEKIFNDAPVSTAINDAKTHKFLLVNKEFTNQSGYTKEDVIGKNVLDVSAWPDENEVLNLQEKLAAGKSVKNEIVHMRKKNGDIIMCLFFRNC